MLAYFALGALNIAFAQECPTAVTSQMLDTQLDSVAMGFVVMDLDKVQSGLDSIQGNIPCLNESISAEVAHEYHMLNGLYLYFKAQIENNSELTVVAENSLRLAKRLAPEQSIPTHLFDAEHFIHEMYSGLEYIELGADIPASPRGVYIFNGQTINRPVATRNIVQIKEGSDIILSAMVEAGAELPVPSAATASTVPKVETEASTTAEPSKTTTPTNNTEAQESVISASDAGGFPWVWTGGVAASSLGYAFTFAQFCGGFDNLYCDESAQDNRNMQVANYAFLGLGALSAYKLAKGKSDTAE